MTGHGVTVPLGPGGEFDLVRRFAAVWGSRALEIGDDAAVVPLSPGMNLVVSTDTSVEGVHFRRDWLTPREIGWRATMAALSDIAAMAARPLGVLTALTIPEAWLADADELAAGIGDAVEAADMRILGGDLSRGSELSICVSVLGSAANPLLRTGAAAGDEVYVTGRLGGPRAALLAWQGGRAPASDYRERFAKPSARIKEALWLAEQGASAGIDLSDGISSDAAHLAAASGVRIEVALERIPCMRDVAPIDAVASGEEYELLVTSPRPLDATEFQRRFDLELTTIGRVTDAAKGGELRVLDKGARVDPPRGHDHFSR